MKVMALADREAAGLNHDRVGTGEILIALLSWFESEASACGPLPLPLKAVDARAEVARITGSGAGVRTSAYSFTPSGEKLFLFAYDEALNLRPSSTVASVDKIVEPVHLLLALLREEEGVACRVLEKAGVDDFAAVRVEILQGLGVNQEDLIAVRGVQEQSETAKLFVDQPVDEATGQIALAGLPGFSGHARELVALAHEAALNHGHDVIGSGHLLLAALSMHKGLLLRTMACCGVERYQVDEELSSILGPGSGLRLQSAGHDEQIMWSPASTKLLQLAAVEAMEWHHALTGVEHIMLVLLREHEGVAGRILEDFDVERAILRNRIMADEQFGKFG